MSVECLSPHAVEIEVGKPEVEKFEYPKISVVVVSYNRPKQVKQTIDSLVRQSVKPYEIIVIDDGSKPKLDLATNFENFQVFRFDVEQGLSNSRNFGVNIAKGEYVAFIDDDAVASPNWLEEVEKAILHGVDVLGGPLMPNFEASPPEWWSQNDYGAIAGVGNASHSVIWGANMIFSKKVFARIGLFDPRLGRQKGKLMSHEERELINKAKLVCKVAFVPSAIVLHSVSAKRLHLRYLLQWRYYDGVSERKLARPCIPETYKMFRNLFKTAILFLKSVVIGDKKARIHYLMNLVYYIGRIA